MCNWAVFTLSILFLVMCFVMDCQRGSLLGSKILGTKCIRTLFCICWQTIIKTFSLGLDLLKVCFNVSLKLSNCRKLLFNSARLDRSKIVDKKFTAIFSNVAQAHMTCRVKCFTSSINGKTLATF